MIRLCGALFKFCLFVVDGGYLFLVGAAAAAYDYTNTHSHNFKCVPTLER